MYLIPDHILDSRLYRCDYAFWSPGNDWFACASSLVTAIGDGYKAISAIPPEQHTLLDQLPDFSQINSSLSTSLAKTAACSYTQEKSFQQELRTWIDNETNATRHRIFPALQAKADKYRSECEAELMSAAAREAEIMTDLRTAQHRSRAKTRGKSPPSPTPRRHSSMLGKRRLTMTADNGNDSELSDSSSTSQPAPADITRTLRAKRTTLITAPSSHPAPAPPAQQPTPPTDPLLASIGALLDQRLSPLEKRIEQRLAALEKRNSPQSSNPFPSTTPPPPSSSASGPHNPPPTQPPQNSFTMVTRSKKKNKNSSYASAAASTAATASGPPPPATSQPKPSNPPRPVQNSPKSTEITVQRPALPSESKETRRSADSIVAHVQHALREAKSDIPLIFGRWAAHTNNFVYVFSGNIPFSRILQISKFLLLPFTEGVLAPVGGWSRILLTGIPTSNSDGKIYSEAELEAALRLNPIFEGIQFVMPPRWLLRPEDISSNYASLTFSVHDPEGSLTKSILQAPIGAFGAHALARRFESRPPLRQCA